MTRLRATLGAIGLSLGGLAPLLTGLVGVRGYLVQGYFTSRTGDRVDGPVGMVVCGFFILAGSAMIIHAIRMYRRHARAGFADRKDP